MGNGEVGSVYSDFDYQTQQVQEILVEPLFDEFLEFDYDTQGNLVKPSHNPYRYVFNDANELIEIRDDEQDIQLVRSEYDAKGRRVIHVSDNTTRIFVYSKNGHLMHEEVLEHDSLDYLYLNGRLIAKNTYELVLGADSDTDADGINDLTEGLVDTDNDGIPNFRDTDSDGDGVTDDIEGIGDADADGTPDFLDSDNDGDGVLDIDQSVVGAFLNAHCSNESPDYDPSIGWVLLSSTVGGVTEKIPYWQTAEYGNDGDLDGDNIPNGFDSDIDGDGINNTDERAFAPPDIDCDGLPHWFDEDSDGDQWPDSLEIQVAIDDIDGDGFKNFVDVDSDGDGLSDTNDPPVEGLSLIHI